MKYDTVKMLLNQMRPPILLVVSHIRRILIFPDSLEY